MPDRPLGSSELTVPPLVLGGMFRDSSRRVNEIERALDLGLDHGLHAVDTAPLYDFGASERLLGHWLRKRRTRITLLGKVGLRWNDDHGDVLFETNVGGMRRVVRRDSRPLSVRRDVEESLGRLGCETLDLVQIHHRDSRTPLAETLGELVRLCEEGKLRAIGISNFPIADLSETEAALGDSPLASTQELYSLLERGAEREILPWVRARGIGFLAYSPLARGLLAGRVATGSPPLDDERRAQPLFDPVNARRVNAALASVLGPIARARGVSVAAVALAWVVARPGVTAAIVGAQDGLQVEAAISALELDLGPEIHGEIDEAFRALVLDRSAGMSLGSRVTRQLRRIGQGLRRARERIRR